MANDAGERVVHLAQVEGKKVAWWTVRARSGNNAWRTWILPVSHTRLVVAGASDALPLRVVVTAVDRFGTESAPRLVGTP